MVKPRGLANFLRSCAHKTRGGLKETLYVSISPLISSVKSMQTKTDEASGRLYQVDAHGYSAGYGVSPHEVTESRPVIVFPTESSQHVRLLYSGISFGGSGTTTYLLLSSMVKSLF